MSSASYRVRDIIVGEGGEKMNMYQRLKDVREDRDLSQSDIAKLLGTTRQQVSKWETGAQMMGADKYAKLAEYYNISVDYLLGLIDYPRNLK